MDTITLDVDQGSEAWRQIRCGKVTASRVADVIAKTKSGWGTSRANYMAQLISEQLTGTVAESFTSSAMQWGTQVEPDARAAYEFRADNDVNKIGFIVHPVIDMSGASPDGLIGESGMLEIKCPLTATHIDTLSNQKVPGKYITQMQWQMACSGRAWCDFCSYDPRMPESMQLFVKRVPRDDVYIASLESDVRVFFCELDAKISALNAIYARKVAA